MDDESVNTGTLRNAIQKTNYHPRGKYEIAHHHDNTRQSVKQLDISKIMYRKP